MNYGERLSNDTGEKHHPPLTKSDLVGAHDLPDSLKSLPGGRIYASNGPRIMLEIITARTAAIIIALTWVVFIICFSIDFYLTYKSFHSSNYVLNTFDCSTYNLTATEQYPQFSCANNEQGTWNATIRDLSNVISFSMDVQQVNMSSLVANRTSNSATFGYNLQVWTCYNDRGCGNSFDYSETYTQDANIWQKVLTLQDATIDVDLTTALVSDGAGDKKISLQLITNTFQNQESIPTNGLVKSYFIILEYTLDPFGLFASPNVNQQAATTYNLNVVRAPGNRVLAGINVVLLIITLGVLGLYCGILYKNIGSLSKWKRALSEQKWVIMYFFLVILFQNPVYCVIFWYEQQPSVTAAYATFLINYIAQSGLFTLWLLFAHSYQRKLQRKTFFYGPKVFIGVTIFVFGVFILTYQFPSLTLPKTNRSSVQAVENWSHTLKISFVVCTIIYLSLIMLWTIIWFVRLVLTGRMMNRLPYMSTRYMQLSFRFFSLQATLVTIYYIAQYVLVAYFISRDTTTGYATSLSVIADNINVLFRQQFQLFGKTFFLTTYAMVLAFMFLPPDMLDSTGFYTTIAATYAVSEDEHREVVRGRKLALKNFKRNLINQVTRYDQLIRAKEDVFCVDLALKMRNISFQAYYDRVDGAQTASSFGKTQDISNFGFELIEEFYDPTHEVYCIISRETVPLEPQDPNALTTDAPQSESRIVVAFRGTASKRQMEDNMNYSQRSVDFHNLDIPSLDHLDRLNIPTSTDPSMDMELESVDGDDEDNVTPITSLSSAYLQRMLTQHIIAQNSSNNATASPSNQDKPTVAQGQFSLFRPPSMSLFARPSGMPTSTAHTTSAPTMNSHIIPENPLPNSQQTTNSTADNVLLSSTVSVTGRGMHKMTIEEEEVARRVLGLRKHRPRHQLARSRSHRDKLVSDQPSNQEGDMVRDIENNLDSHEKSTKMSPSRRIQDANDDHSGLNANSAAGGASAASSSGTGGAFGGMRGGEGIINRAGQVGGNITNFLSDAVGATNQGIDLVVGATTGAMQKAAKHTPGLKKFVIPNVHVGFWEAYTVVRGFLHGVLRAELMKQPCNVIFTGHSLGGALATFAALDFKLTSLPRINAYLKYQAKKQLVKLHQLDLNTNLQGIAASNLTSNSTVNLNEGIVPAGIITSATTNNHNTALALRAAIFPQLAAPRSSRVPQNGNLGSASIRLSHDGDADDNYALMDDEMSEDIEQHGGPMRFRSTGASNTSTKQKSNKFLPRFPLFGAQNSSNNVTGENEISRSSSVDSQATGSDANHSQSNANGAGNNTNGTWGNFLSTQNSQAVRQALQQTLGGGSHLPHQAVFIKKIDVLMYNFGSPRVGNFAFQQLYDKEIPRSYRVVVDGDLVPGLPPSGYRHIGTEILIDSLGVGTIIIDPSFVERWLRTHLKSSISVHSLLVYRKGLLGVKLSAEQLRAYASEKQIENIDPTRLALAWRNRVQIEKMVEHETAEPVEAGTASSGDDSSRRSSFFSGAIRRSSHSNKTDVNVTNNVTETGNNNSGKKAQLPWSLTAIRVPDQQESETTGTTNSGKMNNNSIRMTINSTNVNTEVPKAQYSPLQTPKETNHDRTNTAEAASDELMDNVDTSSADKESNPTVTGAECKNEFSSAKLVGADSASASASTAAGTSTVSVEIRSQSFHSQQLSDDGIALRPVSLIKPVTDEEPALSKSPANTGILQKQNAEAKAVGDAETIIYDSTSDSPVNESEEAKKARLIRQRLMQGRQEEEYYDHTERDYTALMGQIRHLQARSQWHQKVKLVPKFLGLQPSKKDPLTAQPGNVSSNSSSVDTAGRSSANNGQYVPPAMVPMADPEHK